MTFMHNRYLSALYRVAIRVVHAACSNCTLSKNKILDYAKVFSRVCLVAITASTLLLTASCVNPLKTMKDADYSISQNQQRLINTTVKSTLPAPAAVKSSGYYVNPIPISLNQPPAWLKRKITLRAQNVPMSFLVSQILRDTDIAVNYQPGADQNQIVSMNYCGSIKGALDQLAADTNYAYDVSDDEITWEAFITRTFNIAFMPGTSSYQVGQNQGLNAGEAASVANVTSNTGTNNIVNVRGDLGEQQYSNLKGNLSVWDDLKNTLADLKSSDGKVYVSESTTTVTVYDRPSNVQAMANYISQLNKEMSREVAIQVEVLEIELNKEFNYGIDWNAVWNVLGTRIGISGQLGSAANIAGIASQNVSASNNALVQFQIGKLDGNNALINALSQQGRLSVVTQPRVVTMNDQMAEIKITRDVSYLQSVSNTTVANSGNASNTQTLTPGIVTDGFSLYLLPRIQGSKVYLQISSSLSTLTALDTISNNGTSNTPTTDNDNNNTDNSQPFQAIQVPTLANKMFNQRTVISSGSTLVITGFQQTRDETNRTQLAGIQPLGGIGAQRRNVQTIVLITPTILAKN